MGNINIKSERKEIQEEGKTKVVDLYSKAELKKFSPAVLGLGDIGRKSRRIDVIAAVFDLAGFTDFCSQVDPHLSMPIFLKEFLDWLFEEVKSQIEQKKLTKGLYSIRFYHFLLNLRETVCCFYGIQRIWKCI